MESKQTVRRYGVLVKLNEAERNGLAILREREALPGAQWVPDDTQGRRRAETRVRPIGEDNDNTRRFPWQRLPA